jgi:hypothetical protein
MKESHCTQPTTCDRCRENCWPEWTISFMVFHAGENLEVTICDSCIDEISSEMVRTREGSD